MKQLITIMAFVLFGLIVNAQYIYNDFDANQNEAFSGWPNTPSVVANPDMSGINTSANVAEFVRSPEQWAHSFAILPGKINFETGTVFSLKVWSPIACQVLFKLEDQNNGSVSTEVMGNVATPNQWVQLSYNFTNGQSGLYDKIVIFFDFATLVDHTFYFDDVTGPEYGGGSSGDPVTLPVTFEDENVNYNLTDFGGNVSEIVVDPTNASNHVAKSIKTEGAETWAGTTVGGTVGFPEEIPFAPGSTFMTVRVWSPTAGTPIRLKVEDYSDPTKSVETETNTTIGSDWETILFDFSNEAPGTEPIHYDYYFNKASIFFNFGTVGSTGGTTYYWDDMEFGPLISIEKNSVEQLTFLQNPVQDVLTLNTTVDIDNLFVYSLSGQTIKVDRLSKNSYDVSGLTKGAYTVLVIDAEGNNLVGKVLKK